MSVLYQVSRQQTFAFRARELKEIGNSLKHYLQDSVLSKNEA